MATKNQRRPQFGRGPLKLDPAKSVFLNCPYDEAFRPLFDAIVFATICCGFIPRSALESGTIAEPRMERITRAIFESRYSIHDLSRCHGEGDANLARFNMPLELGIAMARRYLSKQGARRHDWLVLVPAGHDHRAVISDLQGFDPPAYDGTVVSLVTTVVAWLATRPDAVRTPAPPQVLAYSADFGDEMAHLRAAWGPYPPWADVVLAGLRVVRRLGGEPRP